MRVELHCHSHCSDGTDPPRVVAERAAGAGVELFCLTDHDTWVGHADTVGVGDGMRVLRGMELSCAHKGRTVHLLLYGLTDGEGLTRLQAQVEILRERRRQRIVDICARFERWNIHLDPHAVLAEAHDGNPGRPHVARALLKAKVVTSVREAFDRFLKDGGPADVPIERLDVGDAVALGVAAGARTSLAHPHTMGHPSQARALFERLRGIGLEGIEAIYGNYAARDRTVWFDMAKELDLVVTAGSDYHGVAVVPDVSCPGIDLPEPHAERLRGWLGIA